ncbi:E3 ubiquitin-protein ligase RLIM-like [Macrosteles quadrilineatus]|uniref:E3 ubiquitin-protein ligase RLIM-like n=1 Tax=Macrosteles quadrilineatus TaxID=74068 RepID=UPI0023E2D13E|nr:E3 ubiquitin-protein ligase RLIM-like [Macrosteles quadrilineatus]
MFRTRRRNGEALRNNIGDDQTQPRPGNMDQSLAQHSQEDITNSSRSSLPRTCKQKNHSSELSSSSGSDDDEFLQSAKFRRRNHFSDYETGESSDMTPRRTRAGLTKRNVQKHDEMSNQNCVDYDSSSVDMDFTKKKVKRPLTYTSSDNDSSDSGAPIGYKRCNKRMRVLSSSESASSRNSGDENALTTASNVDNRLQSNDSESDSEIDVVSPFHTVRGRNYPVIESDDDTSLYIQDLLQESDSEQNNIFASLIADELSFLRVRRRLQRRRRGPVVQRNITIPESDGHNMWWVTTQGEEIEGVSDVISHHRRVRGRRTPVVEESEDDMELNASQNNEVLVSERETVNNHSGSLAGISDSDTDNVRRRRISALNNENQVATRSNARRRIMSYRNRNVSQRGDSSSSSRSSSDSDDSVPERNTRLRGRVTADSVEDVNDVNISLSVAQEILASRNIKQEESISDSGEEESEKCPICLTAFKLQQIGKPTSCNHMFCCKCIKEWATKSNTCPVDRKEFNKLAVFNKYEGKFICEVDVEKPEPEDDYPLSDDNIVSLYEVVAGADALDIALSFNQIAALSFSESLEDGPEEVCYTCGSSEHPDRMISCDSCNTVFHLDCVDPPLEDIPAMNWYCSDCDMHSDSSDYD